MDIFLKGEKWRKWTSKSLDRKNDIAFIIAVNARIVKNITIITKLIEEAIIVAHTSNVNSRLRETK